MQDNQPDMIGTKLFLQRTQRNLSRAELARMSGVSESAIKQYERGLRRPRIEQLELLCAALHLPISYFLSQYKLEDVAAEVGSLSHNQLFAQELAQMLHEPQPAGCAPQSALILEKLNLLNPAGLQKAYEYITDLSEQQKYRNQ